MKVFTKLIVSAAALTAGCSYVHHVPPGQSAAFSLAKKPELVALPPPPPSAHALELPAEAPLPDTEKIADTFALGNLCLEEGRFQEAITAYQNTLKLDPNFSDAWNKLAIAYQDLGDEKKSIEAFKKSKTASTQ